jgi:hypothetical protein
MRPMYGISYTPCLNSVYLDLITASGGDRWTSEYISLQSSLGAIEVVLAMHNDIMPNVKNCTEVFTNIILILMP